MPMVTATAPCAPCVNDVTARVSASASLSFASKSVEPGVFRLVVIASLPASGAWFEAPSEKGPVRVKALLSRVEDADGSAGTALDENLLIACGDGAVRLLKAQREGKGVQDAEVFVRGFPVAAGTVLA